MAFNSQLDEITFTVASGDASSTGTISGINNNIISVTIAEETLDSDILLEHYQGNVDDITDMTPILDSNGAAVTTTIGSGDEAIMEISNIYGIYYGFKFYKQSATTGQVVLTIRK